MHDLALAFSSSKCTSANNIWMDWSKYRNKNLWDVSIWRRSKNFKVDDVLFFFSLKTDKSSVKRKKIPSQWNKNFGKINENPSLYILEKDCEDLNRHGRNEVESPMKTVDHFLYVQLCRKSRWPFDMNHECTGCYLLCLLQCDVAVLQHQHGKWYTAWRSIDIAEGQAKNQKWEFSSSYFYYNVPYF